MPEDKWSREREDSMKVSVVQVLKKIDVFEENNKRDHDTIKNSIMDIRERLVRIETMPEHEKFQTAFCPNTTAIKKIET